MSGRPGKHRIYGLFAVLIVVAATMALVLSSQFTEATDISVVRVGVLPSEGDAELQRRYSPLLQHLSHETGWQFRLVVAESYEHLLDLFKNHEVELAHFGGFTFIKAYAFYDARPLVMRDVDPRITTLAIVKTGSPFRSCFNLDCDALAGKKILFGPQLSTSGHLMPRHFLKTEKGIDPEVFFGEVRHSTGHRATAYQVRDGEADLGMINAGTFRQMLDEGKLQPDELRVIWETPPYPDNAWTIQGGLDEHVQTKLRDAFLALDIANADHRPALDLLGAESFIPAGIGDFLPMMKVVQALGMMTDESHDRY